MPGASPNASDIPTLLCGLLIATGLVLLPGCFSGGETIVAIATHPTNAKILYVATNSAMYKTRDGGDTWEQSSQSFTSDRVTAIAVDPVMSASVYAGTNGDGVYKSSDGGRTWQPFNAGLKDHVMIVNQFAFNPVTPTTVYLASTVGIYRSTNRGRDWSEWMHGMKEVHFVVSLVSHPEDPLILYAGTSGGVYKTANAGRRWTRAIAGMLPVDDQTTAMALGVNALAIDPLEPSIVYAGTTDGLYQTTNGAESWTRIGSGLDDTYFAALAVDVTPPNVVYAGSRAGVHKSTDRGQTWVAMNNGLTNLNIRTLMINPHNAVLYAGTNRGGLFRSTDGGARWEPILGNKK